MAALRHRAGDEGDLSRAPSPLQYETQLGLLAPIEEVVQQVEGEYAIIREHLLGLPGKLGASVAGMTTEHATAILQTEIEEVLHNLSDPGEIAT